MAKNTSRGFRSKVEGFSDFSKYNGGKLIAFIKKKISQTNIIYIILVFILLFIVVVLLYLVYKKGYFSSIMEGMASGSPMSMNVTITNNHSGISNVNPNGYYTAYVKDNPYSVVMTLDQPTNIPFYISKQIQDSSLVTLTVQPITVPNQSKPHYGDVFPQLFNIDVTIDSSFVNLDYYSGALQYDSRITVDSNGVLNANQVGVIMDSSNNNCGYVKKDVYTPQHFFITVTKPIDIKKIVFTWKLGDLSNVILPNEFGPAEKGVIGNTYMHAPSSYIGNTYIGSNYSGYVSSTGQTSLVTGNTNVSGNTFAGNCQAGSDNSTLCSGNVQVSTIR